MKNLFLFFLSISLLIEGCIETCDTQPEIFFKPLNQAGQVLIGSKGMYPLDSLKLIFLRINDNDTTYIDLSNLSSFGKKDSILSISLANSGNEIMYLSYTYDKKDTLNFEITYNKKQTPTCADIVFKYNQQTICTNCNLNDIHNVIK